MSIRTTPYSTNAAYGVNESKIKNAVAEYLVSGDKESLDLVGSETTDPVFVTGWDIASSKLLEVPFPIFVETDKRYLVVDIRSYTKPRTDEYDDWENYIKNKAEFNFIKRLTVFTLAMDYEGVSLSNRLGIGFAQLYSRWISSALSRAYKLNPYETEVVSFITAIFYRTMFYEEVTRENFEDIVAYTSQVTVLKNADISDISSKLLRNTNSLSDLIDNYGRVLEGSKLRKLTDLALYNLLARSWFGKDSGRLIAAALECPPYWIAMVHTALEDTTYRRTIISDMAKTVLRKKGSETIRLSANGVIRDYSED